MRAKIAITVLLYSFGINALTSDVRAQSRQSPVVEALRFFDRLFDGVGDPLGSLRPPRASAAERMRALWDLEDLVVQPDARERMKLAALEPIFAYHERVGYEIRVIDMPIAAVAQNRRAGVLFSPQALKLLSVHELQAAVAHEIGHEYFWSDYAALREHDDSFERQTLELKCDGVAVLTLLALGLDPADMYRAAEKLANFNKVPTNTWGENGYPYPRDRKRFVKTLEKLVRQKRKKQARLRLLISILYSID